MKNGEITVRFAAENELARVNELRGQVSRLHAENRPDVFRPGFCNELRQIAKNAFDADDSDVETYAHLQYRSTSSGRNHAVGAPKSFAGFPNSALMQL